MNKKENEIMRYNAVQLKRKNKNLLKNISQDFTTKCQE